MVVSNKTKKVKLPGNITDYHLWWLLLRARRAMYRARSKELFRFDLSPEESGVLFAITAIGPEATPAKISRWLLSESQSTSSLLTRMEKNDLVKRTRNLERKNLVRITMTPKGEEAFKQSISTNSIKEILSVLSADERESTLRVLNKIIKVALMKSGMDTVPDFPPFD